MTNFYQKCLFEKDQKKVKAGHQTQSSKIGQMGKDA
jgi:hypothetical protein